MGQCASNDTVMLSTPNGTTTNIHTHTHTTQQNSSHVSSAANTNDTHVQKDSSTTISVQPKQQQQQQVNSNHKTATTSDNKDSKKSHPLTPPDKQVKVNDSLKLTSKQLKTEEKYQIIKVLGEGASCKVLEVKDRHTYEIYAMKILNKNEKYNRVLYENEAHILRILQHENILELVDCYEDKSSYHILTTMYTGGELFDQVSKGSFSEKIASILTKEMLKAIQHCHTNNIVHRDLKPVCITSLPLCTSLNCTSLYWHPCHTCSFRDVRTIMLQSMWLAIVTLKLTFHVVMYIDF
jgi:hypothetical protein